MSYTAVLIPPMALRLGCFVFLQIVHFCSVLTQDGKAAVYSCQTQSVAPYSSKRRALTTMIFKTRFSLLPQTERPTLGWRQWIGIKRKGHAFGVVRCN